MNRRFQIIVIILILIIFAISIGSNTFYREKIKSIETVQVKNEKELKDRISLLEAELKNLKEENYHWSKTISNFEYEMSLVKNLVQEQVEIINYKEEKDFTDENLILPIYTANILTYKDEIKYYMAIPKELSLEEKLSTIANKLSQYCFNGLPIEVLEIKKVEGKKIAIIDLKELSFNQGIDDYTKFIGSTWKTYYLQGTTGGAITSKQLVDTFLQKGYQGEWIEGVQFLYEGEIIDYEHVFGLSDIHWRLH